MELMIKVQHPIKTVRRWPTGIRNKYEKHTNGERFMIDPIQDPNGNWITSDNVLTDEVWASLMATEEPDNGGPIQAISASLQAIPYIFEVDSTESILVLENIVGTFEVGETVSQTGPARSSDILSLPGSFLLEVTSITSGFTAGKTITGQTSGATAKIISYEKG